MLYVSIMYVCMCVYVWILRPLFTQGTVRQLLYNKIKTSFIHPQFQTDVVKPLLIDAIIDQEVIRLLQRMDVLVERS